MTSTPTTVSPTPAAGRRSRRRLILGAALVAILAAAAFGAWYTLLRPVPAAVSLAGAVPSSGASARPTTGASPTATMPAASVAASAAPGSSVAAASPAATAAPASSTAASAAPASSTAPTASTASALSGTWTVDASIGSFAEFTNSFVGYRVQEVLAQIGSTTAVGRTPDVTGTLTIDGTSLSAVEIEADLTTLESDSRLRDGQLGRQGLETNQYPTGTFVLTEPISLEAVPADGETISVTATGDMTLHGVTKSVQIPLQAQINNGVITVVGSLEIVFGDFGMEAPSAARVLEIDDQGVMEFQLHFTRT